MYQSFAHVSAIVLIGFFNYFDAKLMLISYLLLSFSYLLMKWCWGCMKPQVI